MKPFELRARRARKWRAELTFGPGSVAGQPTWSRYTRWCGPPVSRRTMRKRIAQAIADPTLESIKVWQVDE